MRKKGELGIRAHKEVIRRITHRQEFVWTAIPGATGKELIGEKEESEQDVLINKLLLWASEAESHCKALE